MDMIKICLILLGLSILSSFADAEVLVNLGPILGYTNVDYSSSSSNSNLWGYSWGGALDLIIGKPQSNFSYGIGGKYLQDVLTNSSASSDTVNQSSFFEGLELRYKRLRFEGGICETTVKENYQGTTRTFSDPGYWASFAIKENLGRYFRLEESLLYSAHQYKSSDNASLSTNTSSSQFSLLVSLLFDFGGGKGGK